MDNISKLYADVSKKLYIGTEDKIRGLLSTKEGAEKFYNVMKDKGVDLGNHTDYMVGLGHENLVEAKDAPPVGVNTEWNTDVDLATSAAKEAKYQADLAKNKLEWTQKQKPFGGSKPFGRVDLGMNDKVVKSDNGQWLTESGRTYDNFAEANLDQNLTDQHNSQSYRLSRMEEQLGEMKDRSGELLKESKKEDEKKFSQALGMGPYYGSMMRHESQNTTAIRKAQADLDDAQEALNELYRQRAEGGETNYIKNSVDFWKNLGSGNIKDAAKNLVDAGNDGLTTLKRVGRGFSDTAGDLSNWDFGVTDATHEGILLSAILKRDNGQPLTKQEQFMLDSAALRAGVTNEVGDLGLAYTSGNVTAASLPFMIEMMANPLSGLGKGATKALTKYVVKKYGKEAVKNNMKKYLATKAVSRVSGDIAGSLGMTATTGFAGTAANAAERQIGSVQTAYDENGNIVYGGHVGGEDALTAWTKAFADRTIENWSEMSGAYFAALGAPIKAVIGKGIGRLIPEKMLQSDFAQWATKKYGDLKNSKFYKGVDAVKSRAQIGGLFEEYLEEKFGDLMRLSIGDTTFDTNSETGIFNLERNVETLVSLIPTQVGFGMLRLGGARTANYQYRQQRKAADKYLDGVLGENWKALRMQLDAAQHDPTAIAQIYSNMNQIGGNIPINVRRAVMNYINAQQSVLHSDPALYQSRTDRVDIQEQDGKFVASDKDAMGNVLGNKTFETREEADAYATNRMEETRDDDMHRFMQTARGLNMVDYNQTAEQFMQERGFDNMTAEEQAEFLDEMSSGRGKTGKAWIEFKTKTIENNMSGANFAISSWEQAHGLEPGTIEDILDRQPTERTIEENDILSEAYGMLHDLAYPQGKAHVEQSKLDGIKLADEANLDAVMDVNEEGASEAKPDLAELAQLKLELETSHNIALNTLRSDTDMLTVFGEVMGNNGADAETVIQTLASMDEETLQNTLVDVMNEGVHTEKFQSVVDAVNAQAKYNAFIQRTGEKIDEKVERESNRRVFKGTLNGAQYTDKPTIITAQDGEHTYQIVNSTEDITTDKDGNVTSQGVFTAIDENGNVAVFKGSPALHIDAEEELPTFAETMRQGLQEAASEIIEPTIGEEVAAENAEGTIAETQSQPTENAGAADAAAMPQPTETAEDATEEARPAEQNAVETQPQSEEQAPQPTYESESKMVYDEKGNEAYDRMPIADTMEDLLDGQLEDEQVAELIDNNIEAYEKEVAKLNEKKPKKTTSKSELIAATNKLKADRAEAERKLKYWQDVKAELAKITHTTEEEMTALSEAENPSDAELGIAGGTGAVGGATDTMPVDAVAMASGFLGNNAVKITPESFRAETGFGTKEQRGFVGMFAGKAKGGKTINEIAEALVEYDNAYYGGNYFKGDSQEARNAIIGAFGQARTRADLRANAVSNRDTLLSEWKQKRDDYYYEEFGMSYDDYMAYEGEILKDDIRREAGVDTAAMFADADEAREETVAETESQPAENTTEEEGETEAVPQSTTTDAKEPFRERAREWSKKTGVDVVLLESIDDVESDYVRGQIIEAEKRNQQVKGWYSQNTGKVFIYMPHAESKEDIETTFIHEVVAHKGLKELLGKSAFDSLCDNVFETMSPEVQAKFLDYVGAKDINNPTEAEKRAAADEYIAHLAEKTDLTDAEKSVWDNIVKMIRTALETLGLSISITDDVLSNLIKASYAEMVKNRRSEESVNENEGSEQQGVRRFRTVYHGSGADFEQFDHSHMGEGEGAQVFGWGTYVTEEEGVGRRYAVTTLHAPLINDTNFESVRDKNPKELMASLNKIGMMIEGFSFPEVQKYLQDRLDVFLADENYKGSHDVIERLANANMALTEEDVAAATIGSHLYKVDIPDDTGMNYLYWSDVVPKEIENVVKTRLLEKLSKGESEANKIELKQKLNDVFRFSDYTGRSLYHIVSSYLGGDKSASEFLHNLGIVGIKYPTNSLSGGNSDGSSNYVIFNEDDLEIVERTRFRIANDNQEIFVSNAEQAVKGIKQEKATPQQWKAMIQSKGGLKAGEDKWLGLSEWIDEQATAKRSLTKQEVLDFIGENKIRIEEVEYGDANSSAAFASLKEEYAQWLREEGSDYAWEQLTDRYGDDADIAFMDLGGELTIGNEEAAAALLGENVINSTRLDYTTEGLENKREIALTVPTIESWNESDDIHFGDAGGGRAVAWVRFGETTDSEGNSVLVIDEIQSKRHQEGREQGYANVDRTNIKELEDELSDLYEKSSELNTSLNNKYGSYKWLRTETWTENGMQQQRMVPNEDVLSPEEYNDVISLRQQIKEKDEEIGRAKFASTDGIPDAPFDKNWHELAMKRMLRLAAEEGFDKVAWTKGEQQADRYQLSAVVDHISYFENEDGTLDARAYSPYGGYQPIGKTWEEVERYVGKDIAKKMQEGVSESTENLTWGMGRDGNNIVKEYKTISGDNLKVGGEGMKDFYDKMLPSFMNKYGKKWGVKVEEVELPEVEEAGRKMWSVDVTPEMKESVMEGQVMFRVKDKNADNLVVMHNISEGDLRKVLETGGLIMPSIAITDVNIGFSGFGDISLLFDKETINPSDRRNKVYGGDAWTPRFPQLVPKLNKEKVKSVADKLYELLSKDLQDYFGLSSEVHSGYIEDNIIRGGIASYYSKDFMKIAYLLGNGKKFKVPMKPKPYGRLSEIIIRLAKEKGVSLDDINNAGYEFYENNPDFVDAIKLADAEARTQNLSSEVREKVRDMILEKPMHFSTFDRAISAARSMEYDLNNGGLKQVVDGGALYEAINKKVKTDNADYNKWVDDLFDGIIEKYGIRNNKDWYTPSGNQRSWEQLYDAATPSNILRYMIAQNTQGGSGGLFDSSIFGASAEEYKSIEEIRERGKKRLHKEESDDYDEWIESVTSRVSDIKNEFLTPSERNDFRSSADANDAIVRAVAKDKTPKGIYSIMKRDYRNFTMEHAKKIADIVKEIQDKSVTYFEAKPQRIVPLSEIRKAIVPSNVDSDIIEGLQKNGIEVATYRRGNENARNRLIKKESNDIRFRFIGEQGAANLDKAEEATTETKSQYAEKVDGLNKGIEEKGLRGHLGEVPYKKMMRTVYEGNDEIAQNVGAMLQDNDWNLYDSIETYLADEAQTMGNEEMWQDVRQSLADAIDFFPSIKDTKYAMWLNKNRDNDPSDPNDGIKRNALMYKLEREEREAPVRFRTTPTPVADQAARAQYEKALKQLGYRWSEQWIDGTRSVAELQKAMFGKNFHLADSRDAHEAEKAMTSKIMQKQRQYHKHLVEPLGKAIEACMKDMPGKSRKERYENLKKYMYALHGLERNRYIHVRDIVEDEQQLEDYVQYCIQQRQELDRGNIDIITYFGNLDGYIRQNIDKDFDADKIDKSGLRDEFPTDTEALSYILVTEGRLKKERVNELWRRVRDVNDFALETEYQSGLISGELKAKVASMYGWYIPLRGFEEMTAEEEYDYNNTEVRAVGGPTLMGAKGRKSKADDPIATMLSIGSQAIHRAERNEVKKKFYRAAKDYMKTNGQGGLVSELFVWEAKVGTDNQGNDIYEVQFPDLTEDMSASEVAKKIADFEAQMKDLADNGKARQVRQGMNLNKAFEHKKSLEEHIVRVYENGQVHVLYLNGNPRAAQSLNGTLKTNNKNVLIKANRKLQRAISQMMTSLNPTFALVANPIRDYQTALMNTLINDGVLAGGKFMLEHLRSFLNLGWSVMTFGKGGYARMFKLYENGKLDMSKEEHRLFKEFADNGGITGFIESSAIEDYKSMMNGMLRTKTWPTITRFLDKSSEFLSTGNTLMENMARFATYKAARKRGLSIQKSVKRAKDYSLNFNQRGLANGEGVIGSLAWLFNFCYLFVNPTMQAFGMMVNNFKNHPAKTTFYQFAVPPMMASMIVPVLNIILASLLDDDDDDDIRDIYGTMPEWKRRNNICLYAGNGHWVTIPLPIELRAFYGIGETLVSELWGDTEIGKTFGWDKMKSDRPAEWQIFDLLMTLTPTSIVYSGGGIDEIEDLKLLVPQMFKPFAEIDINQKWTGAPIWNDSDYIKHNPEWQKAYSNTNPYIVEFCRWLNKATGGDDVRPNKDASWGNINPAKIDHIIQGYFGGLYKTLSEVGAIGKLIVSGNADAIRAEQIPLLKAIWYNYDEAQQVKRYNALYYKYKEEAEATTAWERGYTDRGDIDGLLKLMAEPRYKRREIINDYETERQKFSAGIRKSHAREDEDTEEVFKRIRMLSDKAIVEELDKIK